MDHHHHGCEALVKGLEVKRFVVLSDADHGLLPHTSKKEAPAPANKVFTCCHDHLGNLPHDLLIDLRLEAQQLWDHDVIVVLPRR